VLVGYWVILVVMVWDVGREPRDEGIK
jgi:hypothetical protein